MRLQGAQSKSLLNYLKILKVLLLTLLSVSSLGQQISLVADINTSKVSTGVNGMEMFTFRNKIYFKSFHSGEETIEYDGNIASHSILSGYKVEYISNDSILFLSKGTELWSYDGTFLKRENCFLPSNRGTITGTDHNLFFIQYLSVGFNIWIWNGSDSHIIANSMKLPGIITSKNSLYIISDKVYKYNKTDSLVETMLPALMQDPVTLDSQLIYKFNDTLYRFDEINKPLAITRLTTAEDFTVQSTFYHINKDVYFYGNTGISNERKFLKFDGENASVSDMLDDFKLQFDTISDNINKTINIKNRIFVIRYHQLWTIDGIHKPFMIPFSGFLYCFDVFKNNTYFVEYYGSGDSGVKYSDGSVTQALRIETTKSSSPSNLTVFKGNLYFFAQDSVGYNLYKYDDINPPTLVERLMQKPIKLIAAENRLYIVEETEIFPWDGQHEFLRIPNYTASYWTIGDLLFIYRDKKLWAFDGFSEKKLVLDNISYIRGYVFLDNLYLFAFDEITGCRIYTANAAGGFNSIYSGKDIIQPDYFFNHDNELFFIAKDLNYVKYFWKIDASNDIHKLINIENFIGYYDILYPINFKGKLYFLSDNYMWSYNFKENIDKIKEYKSPLLFCTDDFIYLSEFTYTWIFNGKDGTNVYQSFDGKYAITINHTDYISSYGLCEKDYQNNILNFYDVENLSNFQVYKKNLYFTGSRQIEGNELFKLSVPDTILNITACKSYGSITQPGIYFDTIPGLSKPDSIVKLKLTFAKDFYSQISVTANDSMVSPGGRYCWFESGIYNDTLQSIYGCDSIITVILKITHNTFKTIREISCDHYLSPSGRLLTESGIISDTIPNTAGYDSIITIQLQINHSDETIVNREVCNSFLSPSGRYTWNESGQYSDTLTNLSGCDSIITVNLTVNHTSESNIIAQSCDYYISPGGKNWTTSGIYRDTIPSSCGCDSVITINLQIDHVNTAVIQDRNVLVSADLNANHQWIDADNKLPIEGETYLTYTPDHSGKYAVILTQGTCVDTSSVFAMIVTGNEMENNGKIQLYPNPTNGKVTIDLGKTYTDVDLTVINSTGIVVQEMKIKNAQKPEFNLNEPGMYLVKIRTEDGETIRRVIKQ